MRQITVETCGECPYVAGQATDTYGYCQHDNCGSRTKSDGVTLSHQPPRDCPLSEEPDVFGEDWYKRFWHIARIMKLPGSPAYEDVYRKVRALMAGFDDALAAHILSIKEEQHQLCIRNQELTDELAVCSGLANKLLRRA